MGVKVIGTRLKDCKGWSFFSTSNNLLYEKDQNDFKLKKYRFMALTKSTIESKVQLLLKKLL